MKINECTRFNIAESDVGPELPSVEEIAKRIEEQMYYIADYISEFETDSTSTPSAPDTTKFRAIQSGKVEVERNYTTWNKHSGGHTYPLALKVGKAMPAEAMYDVVEGFNIMSKEFPQHKYSSGDYFFQGNNGWVQLQRHYGTSFDTFTLSYQARKNNG